MTIELPYGTTMAVAPLTWGTCLGTLDIADAPALPDPAAAVRHALDNPIGLDGPVAGSIEKGKRVAILVSDSFRSTGADIFLPVLIAYLEEFGISSEDIIIVFATGTHRAPTDEEQRKIVGPEIYQAFQGRLFSHDAQDTNNLVTVGTTSRGTRVDINRRVYDCDCIIATGSVVYHYFGGFGGGRKSVVPGIASAETIAHNHAMNLDPLQDRLNPNVAIGRLDGNPVAEDMLEATRLVGVDFIVNTVLSRHGQISAVFVGELDAAHRAACAAARDLFTAPISGLADMVIASSGSTRNFVQTHKALYNAYQAIKPGGRILLLAECPEGLGGEQFVKWLRLGSREAIIAELRRQSEINGQTALSTLEKAPSTVMVTGMSYEEVQLLGALKADSFMEGLFLTRHKFRTAGIEDPTYYLMPSAAYTVPVLSSCQQ